MTLRTFARRTGWPLAELLQLRWTDCNELLALYGLQLRVTPIRDPRVDGHEGFFDYPGEPEPVDAP